MTTPAEISETFAALLAKDDESLVQEVYEWIHDVYDWTDGDDLPELGSHARIVGDVAEADFLIGEAGFYSLLTAPNMDEIESVPDAFDAIGGHEAAQTIRDVFATVRDPVLSSPSETRALLVDESDFSSDFVDSAENSYFEHEPQPRPLLARYIRKHAVSFAEFFAATGPTPEELGRREQMAAEWERQEEASRAAVAPYNSECQALLATLKVCPRCGVTGGAFRCITPEFSNAYFVCKECGRSFKREEI